MPQTPGPEPKGRREPKASSAPVQHTCPVCGRRGVDATSLEHIFAASIFMRTWFQLGNRSQCDDADGAEYRRILQSWLEAGRPTPVLPFLQSALGLPGKQERY
jgi:hypothetical protein